MESRPSYQATKSDWYTHSRALPPQLSAGCAPEKGWEELQKLIDDLPVEPADANTSVGMEIWIEPGWGWCDKDMAAARREAAERIIHNNENIVRFASRAAGTPGLPASAAPLADPRATPSQEAEPAVDLLLRHVVDSLLSSQGAGAGGMFASMLQAPSVSGSNPNIDAVISSLASGPSGGKTVQAVADCLDYLRARIGVPRDMTHPAAQTLRAELKAMSRQLRQSAGILADANGSGEAMAAMQ
jgi:glutathione S-transferase